MQIRKPVLIIEAGLLLAFFLATLYILFAKRDMPSSNRPPDAGSATAATAAAAPPAASAAAAPTVAPVPATAAEVLGRAPVAELAVQNPGAGVGGSVPLGSSCSFDATVYDVRLNPDQISRLDIDALTRDAATREGFEKALTALGTSRQIARANQAANFNQEQYVKLTNETPYVTGSTITATGQTENTVAFRNTGTTFDLIAHAGTEANPGLGVITLDIAIKSIVLLEGVTQLTPTVKAPVFRTLDIQTQRTIAPDKPFLFMNADAASLDANGKAMALIARHGEPLPVVSGAPAAGPRQMKYFQGNQLGFVAAASVGGFGPIFYGFLRGLKGESGVFPER